MAPLIRDLIDPVEGCKTVVDLIAAILVVESDNQQRLAQAAGKNPDRWRLDVYTERSNAWDLFPEGSSTANEPPPNPAPIVNIIFDRETFDATKSGAVNGQHASANFFLDCYGYGVTDETDRGHRPGDASAVDAAKTATGLVRKILMAEAYTYLGLRGTISSRRVADRVSLQMAPDLAVDHVHCLRMQMSVSYKEFSPKVQGELLELIAVTVDRPGDGKVILRAQYPHPATPHPHDN